MLTGRVVPDAGGHEGAPRVWKPHRAGNCREMPQPRTSVMPHCGPSASDAVTTFGFWAESLGHLVNMADPAVSLRDVRERTAQRVAELLEVFDAIVESSAAAVRDDEALSHDSGLDRAELSSMVERARAQLAEINEALERLRRGSYG